MTKQQEATIHDYREKFLKDAMIELEKCRERMQGFETTLLELSHEHKETRALVLDLKNAHDGTKHRLDQLYEATEELVEVMTACKGGLKAIGWVSKLAVIIMPLVTLWQLIKHWLTKG